MKSGWTIRKLGEVCEVVLGGTPKTSVSEYWGGSIPWLTPGDMGKMMGPYVERTSRMLTQKGLENGSTLFPARSVIISTRAPIGYVFINRVPMATNQGCKTLVPTADVWPEFLYYNILGRTHELNDLGTGTTFKELATGALKGMEISLPPLPEQKRIVAKIDAAFEKIDKLKANAERNLENARELFQSALDEAMRPKKGWVEKRLGEVCKITSVLVDPTEKAYRNLLHVGGANIVSEIGSLVDLKTAAEEKLKSGKFTFDESMVLYNKIRPYLKKVARPNFKGLCSADMYPLSPVGGVERGFLYYLLLSSRFTAYAIGESERAGMPKVNRESLFAYELKMPPNRDEQEKISRTLDQLCEKLSLLQQHYTRLIADCAEMRQSVLREAFEGRL